MAIKRLRKINLALLIATVIKFVNIIVTVVINNVTQTVKCCEADSGYKSNSTLKGSVYKQGYEEGYKAYTPIDYCHTCNSQDCNICDCNKVCSSCDSCDCVSHCDHCEDCTDCSSNTTGGGAR